MKLLFLGLIYISSAFAHDQHDWRSDIQAYLNLKFETPLVLAHKKSRPLFHSLFKSSVDMDYFKTKLKVLASTERSSEEGLDLARAFLKTEYEKLGFVVSFQEFGDGINFIAEKKGTKKDAKILILSSHIDSWDNHGANDNGTGTIGLLSIAESLRRKNIDHTLRIIGFDGEEDGLLGSDAYTVTLDKTQILGNINLEMIGYHSMKNGFFHVIDCDREESLFLSQAIKKSISQLKIPLTVSKTCSSRSDHASFWRRDIPAIVISENFFGGDGDPCYHESCDIIDERLNYKYIENILNAVLDTTENFLE